MWRQKKIAVTRLLILEYENGQREVFAGLYATGGRCMTAKDACRLMGQALGGQWVPAREGRSVITRTEAAYRFVEEGKYRLVYGVAGQPKGGETVSGDSFTFHGGLPGQVVISLSDGMGSGGDGLPGERPRGGAGGGTSGDGILPQGRPEDGEHRPSAGGGRAAPGDAGSGLRGPVFRRAGDDEAGGRPHLCAGGRTE